MENQKLDLPLGYKFNPTASELVIHYLLNKILGRSLPANVIPTFDCFSCSPARLPFDQFKYGKTNEWYFFSRGREGKIVATEEGYYEEADENPIYEGDKIVGSVRRFEFYHGKPPSRIESEWSIMEFRLHPELLKEQDQPLTMDSNLVVCEVIRDMLSEGATTRTLGNTTIRDNGNS